MRGGRKRICVSESDLILTFVPRSVAPTDRRFDLVDAGSLQLSKEVVRRRVGVVVVADIMNFGQRHRTHEADRRTSDDAVEVLADASRAVLVEKVRDERFGVEDDALVTHPLLSS